MFHDKETETFFAVVHMFQRSAMANLGLLEHPEGGLKFNFSEARDIIDILRMLQNKTQGNLERIAGKPSRTKQNQAKLKKNLSKTERNQAKPSKILGKPK